MKRIVSASGFNLNIERNSNKSEMSFKVDFIEELKLGLKGIFGSDLVVKEGLDHFKIHVEEIAGTQLHELSTLVKKADLGSHLRRSGTGITILLFKL